ncbi:MAG: copper chaperone PCu(A)C [Antricoccus sp.]
MTESAAPRIRSALPLRLIIPVFAIVLGAAALVWGLTVQGAGSSGAAKVPTDAVRQGGIAIYGQYVREPASAEAAAYLSIINTSTNPDMLLSISCDASASAVAHDVGMDMGSAPSTENTAMAMTPTPTFSIGAGKTVALKPGGGHIMLEQLTKSLTPGMPVKLTLTFKNAGAVTVTAKVIAIGAAAPSGS